MSDKTGQDARYQRFMELCRGLSAENQDRLIDFLEKLAEQSKAKDLREQGAKA